MSTTLTKLEEKRGVGRLRLNTVNRCPDRSRGDRRVPVGRHNLSSTFHNVHASFNHGVGMQFATSSAAPLVLLK